MSSTKAEIKKHLDQLVGLPLSIARRAANMLVLHFGTIREVEGRRLSRKKRKDKKGTVGDFALHIQCPWRLENSEGIITGRGDLYLSAETGNYFDDDEEDDSFDKQGMNLQDRKMGELLQGIDPITGSYMNVTNFLIVESIESDDFGEATIYLSGGYRLRIFPSSSTVEHWRLFQPATEEKHFVVEGSEVEAE
ncbi:MAG TPA: hypothetical protein VFQ23_05265 [Anaerolineales bacterium]|nr:hypothetical protein [Anaerolineales bacterium]